MRKGGYVYILTNQRHTVLYTGVISDMPRRLEQHRTCQVDSFTCRYRVHKLVYYGWFDGIEEAIGREKQIKGGSRQDKLDLIGALNPKWKDLLEETRWE